MTLFELSNYYSRALAKIKNFPDRSSKTRALTLKQTQDLLASYPEFRNELFCSKQRLQHIRNERLRKILIYAKSYSPWYQKSLAHIDVENFREERLSEIPVMNKNILMENWNEIVTDRKLSLAHAEKHIAKMRCDKDTLYLNNRYHVLASSGSSGNRGVYVYDWDEWNYFYLSTARYPLYNHNRSQRLIDPCQKLKVAQVVITNTIYAMYSISKTFFFSNIEKFYLPVTLPIRQIVDGLNQIRPDILLGTPTTIYKLCQEAVEGRLKAQPKIIGVSGEPLYKPIRELITSIWPEVNLFNTLGSSEGLWGVNCQANSEEMHLNDDLCIVEPVDEKGHRVEKTVVPQKIYLTNLYNYTLPLIRYELSDQLVFLDKTCECGIQHQLIVEPQGRPEFDFLYPDNIFVHHLVFVTPILLEKNIREYQVIQTKNGADIKILATGSVDKIQLQKTIASRLIQLGLTQPQVNLFEVTQFDYPESGKLRRFLKLD
ncbi:phenylacetate--CoA ligase family protein [Fluoribacter dumoffii]|uniref:Putative adenylate-forming enzyme n=1 Tax=Fluoribacter dumoffii TaxID=463 RepID=A0A377GC04_9GAMM|nr:phenylacetate--CoA ligase family protein [Fluoribacter dumoffii]KTC90676.1 coenzyme F390 synthetase [Fluoribacter dumoffii NY 23]STO22357.1 putative adenylate-forming enzyme [Fluoribacter dumoffii]